LTDYRNPVLLLLPGNNILRIIYKNVRPIIKPVAKKESGIKGDFDFLEELKFLKLRVL